MRTFRAAWSEALYGPAGFYRRGRGAGTDFRTSSTAGGLGLPLLRLAAALDRALGRPAEFSVCDVGAGDGSLLAELADLAPRRWRLVGVEVAPRPAELPARVRWRRNVPAICGLLVAVELLDVVPCEVATGGRLLLADGRPGPPPQPADARWLDRWWPGWRSAADAEVGRYRDLAWSRLTGRLQAGLALAVDYGHVRAARRPTLTGYRGGRACRPRTDGTTDVTAHVALDSLAGRRTTQRAALAALGVRARAPDPVRAAADGPCSAAAGAELLDPGGLGGFAWVSRPVRAPSFARLAALPDPRPSGPAPAPERTAPERVVAEMAP